MPVGTTVTTQSLALSGGVPTTTGTLFVVGQADGGSAATPTIVRSIGDFISNFATSFAARTPNNAILYDTVDVFFREGGQQAYVLRALAGTEVASTLTLNSATPNPTVLVTAKYAGTQGNNFNVVITVSNNATFTANTTTTTPNLTAISSFTNIGVGTPVSGTGIPANTYILSVNVAAATAVMSANATATASGVVITPTGFVLTLQDPNANVLETHPATGNFINTAALYLDLTSTLVNFAQSAGGGNTPMSPATLAATPLAGGTNATPTDAQAVTALATFSASLGPGTVALPGRTTTTAWNGLLAHAQGNNRWAPLDIADSTSTGTLVAAIGTTGTAANASYGAYFTSSAIVPGLVPGTTRTVPASAVVAGLRARVAATGNDNQTPAGVNWPLFYVSSFTNEAFATYGASGINTLNSSGINVFANRGGVLCLFGAVSPVSQNTDSIFWQFAPATERMALVANASAIAEPFLFSVLDGQGITLSNFRGQLQGLIQAHWRSRALYGLTATLAGAVNVDPPINTAATAAAGQLNAQLKVRLSPTAQTVSITVMFVPTTQIVTATG
jgi:hypothetical protein